MMEYFVLNNGIKMPKLGYGVYQTPVEETKEASTKMQLKLDNLLIKKMGQDYVIPLSDISIIVAEGGETVVTLRLLSALSKYNIALIVCDNEHLPTGIYHSQNGHFRAYKKLQEQLLWTQEQKDKLWQ